MSEMGEVVIPVRVEAGDAFRKLDREAAKMRTPVVKPRLVMPDWTRGFSAAEKKLYRTSALFRAKSAAIESISSVAVAGASFLSRALAPSEAPRARRRVPSIAPALAATAVAPASATPRLRLAAPLAPRTAYLGMGLGMGVGATSGAGVHPRAEKKSTGPKVSTQIGQLRFWAGMVGFYAAVRTAQAALDTYSKAQASALPPEMAARQKSYLAATADLGFAFRSLQVQGIDVLAPALTDLAKWTKDLISGNGQQFLQWLGVAAAALKVSALETLGRIPHFQEKMSLNARQLELGGTFDQGTQTWNTAKATDEQLLRIATGKTVKGQEDISREQAMFALGARSEGKKFDASADTGKAWAELGDWISGRKTAKREDLRIPAESKATAAVDRDMGTFSGVAAGKIGFATTQDRMLDELRGINKNTAPKRKPDPAVKAQPRKFTGEEVS